MALEENTGTITKRRHTDETRAKISASHLGKKKPWAVLVGLSKRGIKLSEDHKAKIGAAIRGRKESVETRLKKSQSMKGKNYRGGPKTTKTAKNQIRKSVEYKIWRDSVFSRDSYRCQMPECSTGEKYVEANHIKRFADFPELRYDTRNGVTLCRPCHKSIYNKELEYETLFSKIIIQNGINS